MHISQKNFFQAALTMHYPRKTFITSIIGRVVVSDTSIHKFNNPNKYIRSYNCNKSVCYDNYCNIGILAQWLKTRVWVREVSGSVTDRLNWTPCRQQLATAAMFLRSCVAQALSRQDRFRHLLHALVQYREYNEDLT